MAAFQPADTLRSRTFVGLLVAQFLAAFNDQAIHASAMFFAINRQALSESQAISLMPILFYAPWALFCTLAGYLADRYCKRSSLVFWKVAEIGITLTALVGFWIGTQGNAAGPGIVLATVFLMGTHSAFFVPAKYGAMPEILQPHMLSRGNGILESLSFLAVILGTVFGGILSTIFHGREYFIGVVLVMLAVVGALASLAIRRMPAANPTRPFPRNVYGPLYENVRGLLRSRPLAFAVTGIAFFTFIVAFMRATVYLHGEVQSPRWAEAQTSVIVGMVALGIGLGSPFVGFLSGEKVELGLVPPGALGMVAAALVAAGLLGSVTALVVCITLIGFFTGIYIVPLFTLLQHRAPKTSKGDSIATSNFINVTGAILASVVVYGADLGARWTGVTPAVVQTDRASGELAEDPHYLEGRLDRVVLAGRRPVTEHKGKQFRHAIDPAENESLIDPFKDPLRAGDRVVESTYNIGEVRHHAFRREGAPRQAVYDKRPLPQLLFAGAALMTLFTLFILVWQMPDLFLRTALWFHFRGRFRLNLYGANNVPAEGAAVLVSNAAGREAAYHVLAATDRTARVAVVATADGSAPGRFLRWLAARSTLECSDEALPSAAECPARKGLSAVLARGELLCITVPVPRGDRACGRVMAGLHAACAGVPVVPVYHEIGDAEPGKKERPVYILFGATLPVGTSYDEAFAAVSCLGDAFRAEHRNGVAPAASGVGAH